MKVIHGLGQLPRFKNPVLTIGTFDGVHLGHRAILQRMLDRAAEVNGDTIIITFDPHPRYVVSLHQKSISLLSTPEEKQEELEALGIDYLVIVPFNTAFAAIEARNYVQDFLVHYFHPHTLIIGFDHQFGHKRLGNFKLLESLKDEFGYTLEEIPMQEYMQSKISSTQVREALHKGDVAKAAEYLGRPYSMSGKVVTGEKRGRQLGYPTANIEISDARKLLPAKGVYAVWVEVGSRRFGGMLNMGTNPTFTDSEILSPEVHLFDFDADLYGTRIKILFVERLREELKFENPDQLKYALQRDEQRSRAILNLQASE